MAAHRIVPRMLKASWLMLIVFIIMGGFDLHSTLSTGELATHLETNLLYIITNSFWPILAANVIFIWLTLHLYNYKRPLIRFSSVTLFVWISILRFSVIINNYKTVALVKTGEITMEMVQQIPTADKISGYSWLLFLGLYVPSIITILIYLIFRLDNRVVRNGKEPEFKNNEE